MKLYRVVPNIFSYEERLKCGIAPNVEAIYYKLGYASFIGSTVMNKGNNVFNQGEKIKMGKFFFLFPEDAIMNGYTLLIGAQRLRFLESFYVLEYDFPEELIVKHFGYGDYSTNIPLYLMETYIEKEDFIMDVNEIKKLKEISNDEKNQILVKMLTETLGNLKINLRDYCWYDDFFAANYGRELHEFINDPKNIELAIKDNIILLPPKGEIIKTKYLTGKSLLIDLEPIIEKYRNWENASEYFNSLGVRYDVSKEQESFKQELIYASGYNSSGNKDQEKVLSLLKSRNYL